VENLHVGYSIWQIYRDLTMPFFTFYIKEKKIIKYQ